MSNITQLPAVQTIDTRYTQDVIPILDTSKFEHMQRIATVMAETTMIPNSLRGTEKNGVFIEFERKMVIANCFRVVNQAVRWGMDPFAVSDCASIIHGRLMWEGKLVAAVIGAKIGVNLAYAFDEKPGQELGITVSGTLPGEANPRTIFGRVKDWHKGPKSPWGNEGAWRRQLRYMGNREWARAHAPAIMLGVYADDELHEIAALDVPTGQRAIRLKSTDTPKAMSLPDIPDTAPEPPTLDETDDGPADAIKSAINVEMLEHIRSAYPDADWEVLAPAYDAKFEELKARAV